MVGNSFVCPSEVFGKCLVVELNFKMISDNIQPPCTSGVKPVSGKFPGKFPTMLQSFERLRSLANMGIVV